MADKYICTTKGCGASTRVKDNPKDLNTQTQIVRNRICENGHTHRTFERPDRTLRVQRSDWRQGRVEDWDEDKVKKSIEMAIPGGPAAIAADADKILNRVTAALTKKYGHDEPIPTWYVGEEVIRQFRGVNQAAALRYALKFYPSRPEKDKRPSTLAELARIFREDFGWKDANDSAVTPDRPQGVTKSWKPNHGPNREEPFLPSKLWRSVAIAVKGMLELAHWRPDASADESPEQREKSLVGAIVVDVLDQLKGHTIVSSGQISTACMNSLAEVHPFGAARYAIYAKKLVQRSDLITEVLDAAHRDDGLDAAALSEKWTALYADERTKAITEECLIEMGEINGHG